MKRYRLASWIMGLALILTLGAVPVLAAEENGGISPGDVIARRGCLKGTGHRHQPESYLAYFECRQQRCSDGSGSSRQRLGTDSDLGFQR